MKRISFPLTYKMLFALMAVLLPILAVFFITFQNNKKHLERRLLYDLSFISDYRGKEIALFLDRNGKRVADLSADRVIARETEKAASGGGKPAPALESYLNRSRRLLSGVFSRISVVTADGRVAASTLSSEKGKDISGERFFTSGLLGPSVVDYSEGGTEPWVVMTSPITGGKGRVVGVVAGFIPFSRISESFLGVTGVEEKLGGQTLELYLVGRDGLALTQSRFVENAELSLKVDTVPVRACLEEGMGMSGFYADYRGVEVAGASRCVGGMGWVLLAEVDKDEALKPVEELAWYAVGTGLFVAALIGALAFYFVKVVKGRLGRLVWASKEIRRGNYDLRLPVETSDEIGELSESFNAMARVIKDRDISLRNSRQRLADAQRIAHIGSWHLDIRTNSSRRSREVYRIFGATKQDFPQTPEGFLSFVHPQDRPRVRASIGEAIRLRGPYSIDYRIVRPDGAQRVIHSEAEVEVDESGEPARMAGTIQDVTELKRAEEEARRLNAGLERKVAERTAELEAANRELESFSYSVAHDLRSPLRVIEGFSRSVIEKCESAGCKGQGDLWRIRAASERMTHMIDDLLNLSSVMRSDINRQEVNLSGLAGAIAADLRAADPHRDVEFAIAPGLAATGDERLLRVVLENLLENAWKFTGGTAGALIEFGSSGTEGGNTEFFVRDNGAGFDMKYAEKLFGAFQRLHRAEEFPGTGIGLATVQRVISRHGGRVWAEGSPGRGAAFYFSIQSAQGRATGQHGVVIWRERT